MCHFIGMKIIRIIMIVIDKMLFYLTVLFQTFFYCLVLMLKSEYLFKVSVLVHLKSLMQ